MGAEADTVAGIPTGQTENIRPAVAAMRRAIHNRSSPVGGKYRRIPVVMAPDPGAFSVGMGLLE